jgi:L-asparaginase
VSEENPDDVPRMRRSLSIVSTGGTIEKTYSELGGELSNRLDEPVKVLDVMLGRLELPELSVSRVSLMNKDSLDMTEADHTLIAETVERELAEHGAVVVVHGTDRLPTTGERILEHLSSQGPLAGPVVLTGAMRPYELRRTDAVQNLTEALLAARMLPPGVYCVMHNDVLPFPGVVKDRERSRFRRSTPSPETES